MTEAEPTATLEELFGAGISDDEETKPAVGDAATDSAASGGAASAVMTELFGEDEDEEIKEEKGSQSQSQSQSQSTERDRVPEERASAAGRPVSFDTRKQLPFAAGSQLLLAKLPNVVSIEGKPFDPETHELEQPRTVTDDDSGARKIIRLTSENVIRWRVATDSKGDKIRESNARIARWPDGRTTLHLGSEVFDVHEDAYSEESSSVRSVMYAQLDGAPIRKSMGTLSGAIKFMPTSLESQSHQKLKSLITEQHTKMPKIRRTHDQEDPDKAKAEKEKLVREQESAENRKRKKQERTTKRQPSKDLDSSFLENDEDEAEAELDGAGAGSKSAKSIDENAEDDHGERALKAKRGAGGRRRKSSSSSKGAAGKQSKGAAGDDDDEEAEAELDAADEEEAEETGESGDSEDEEEEEEEEERSKRSSKKDKKRGKKRKREEEADDAPEEAVPTAADDDDGGAVVKRPKKKKRTLGGDGDDDEDSS